MGSLGVSHNVYKPWSGALSGSTGALATAGAGVLDADLKRSPWYDVSGWTDKVIAWEVDSGGTIDFDLSIHISSRGAYELNALTAAGTLTTDDYVALAIVDAHTTAVYTKVDGEDFDELQRPMRSLRVEINNDQAAVVTGCEVWVEGWS